MNLFRHKKILIFVGILLLLAILPIVIIYQQQQTQTESDAAQTTTLSFTPTTSSSSPHNTAVGETVSFDVMLTPVSNAVSLVKLQMLFDIRKLAPQESTPVQVDTSVFPEIVEAPTIDAAGRITMTVSIGNDPARAVISPSRVATLTFRALDETGQAGPTLLQFGPATEVYSVAPADQSSENVYSNGTPAYIAIGPPLCVLPAPPANAEYYDTLILGSNEVPPNNSQASGKARVRVDPTNSSLVYVTFCYDGITGTVAEAGIHIAPPGQTAPTTMTLPGSSDPDGNRDFVTDHMMSIVPVWLQNLRDGLWYIEIKSTGFPNGEIRGQFGTFVAPTPTFTPTPTTIPTSIPTTSPTMTPIPLATQLSFTAFLHGIGNSGDNANPSNFSFSNKTPLHTQRTVAVEIFNASNQSVANATGTLVFNPQAGNFQGTVDMGTGLSSGIYTVKIKTNQFLRRLIPGFQTLTPGQTNTMPSVQMVNGNVHTDSALNILDYNMIISCYSDLRPAISCTPEQKEQADITDDGKVNQIDYNLFLRELSVQQED